MPKQHVCWTHSALQESVSVPSEALCGRASVLENDTVLCVVHVLSMDGSANPVRLVTNYEIPPPADELWVFFDAGCLMLDEIS